MLAKNSSTEYFIVSNRRQRLWKVSRLSWYVEHFNRDAIFHLSRALADDAWRSCSPNYCKDFFFPYSTLPEEKTKKVCDYPEKKTDARLPLKWFPSYTMTWLLHVELHALCSSAPESITSLFWCLFLTSWRSCSCLSEFLLSRTNLSNVIEMPKSHLSNADFLFL